MVGALATAFEMLPSQATKLMTGNNKDLYKLCVAGHTGSDYSKIAMWY